MCPFVFLDIETTGIDPSRDHIIEIACVKWKDFKILERFESLVNPRMPIPQEIVILTGITDSLIHTAPLFSEIKEKIIQFVGSLPVIGHNIPFDTSFLKSHHFEIQNPEIDTLSLARILLLKESSYALEVLMKKYRLPARNSHRAMADVLTTVHFFEFLLGEMRKIPSDVWEVLKPVLEKSKWAGREVFDVIARSDPELACPEPCRGAEGERSVASARDRLRNPVPFPTAKNIQGDTLYWNNDILQTFLKGQKILLESPTKVPFDLLKNTPLLIAYSSVRKRNELMAQTEQAGLSVGQLKEPSFYLSPKKLKALTGQVKISAGITPFLLKMLLWNLQTKSGDREEISLEREEYGFFELVADTEGKDVFWQSALSKAKACTVVLVHQYGLAHGLQKYFLVAGADGGTKEICTDVPVHQYAATTKNTGHGLIIQEASHLEDSFTNALKKKYTEARLHPFFGEKATVIFGLLGIFYEHFVEKEYGGYRGNVILDEALRNSLYFKRVFEAAINLPNHSKKDEFIQALTENQNRVSWVSLFASEVSFTSAPILIAEAFHESIVSFPRVILQSEGLSGDGTFQLLKKIFALGAEWKEVKEPEKEMIPSLDIRIPEDFPAPSTEGYFKKCLSLFTEIIEKKNGESLLLLSSKKAVEAFYSALLPKAEEHGVKLLGVGVSGGTGKSLALFLENPKGCVLLATNQIMPYLHEIEEEIDIIVFQKIPFDSPSDPLCKIRSSRFKNGFNEYTLPRAIMKFRELLTEFSRGKAKICHILDSRLQNREYGRMFI